MARLEARLGAAAGRSVERRRDTLHATVRTLQTMSPLATLTRGYAVLTETAPEGSRRTVTSIAQARPGQALTAHLQDGALAVRVEAVDDDNGLPRLPALDDR